MIAKGHSLATRGTYFSARSKFINALRTVAAALDADRGTQQHTQALFEGLEAMREAADFTPDQPEAPVDLTTIIPTHRTRVLKNYDLQGFSLEYALVHYFTYARQRLITASGGFGRAVSPRKTLRPTANYDSRRADVERTEINSLLSNSSLSR